MGTSIAVDKVILAMSAIGPAVRASVNHAIASIDPQITVNRTAGVLRRQFLTGTGDFRRFGAFSPHHQALRRQEFVGLSPDKLLMQNRRRWNCGRGQQKCEIYPRFSPNSTASSLSGVPLQQAARMEHQVHSRHILAA